MDRLWLRNQVSLPDKTAKIPPPAEKPGESVQSVAISLNYGSGFALMNLLSQMPVGPMTSFLVLGSKLVRPKFAA
jgi:hypothetical protein